MKLKNLKKKIPSTQPISKLLALLALGCWEASVAWRWGAESAEWRCAAVLLDWGSFAA